MKIEMWRGVGGGLLASTKHDVCMFYNGLGVVALVGINPPATCYPTNRMDWCCFGVVLASLGHKGSVTAPVTSVDYFRSLGARWWGGCVVIMAVAFGKVGGGYTRPKCV